MPPGAVAPTQKQSMPAAARQATQANGEAVATKDEEQATQKLLKDAEQIEHKRKVLQLATMEPFKEPARPLSHWDFVLKEMHWMAVDFTEERHWKRAASRAVAHEIAAVTRSSLLKHTAVIDEELQSCQQKEAEVADMLKARINSGKAASTSQAGSKPGVEDDSIFADLDTDGSLAPGTPLNEEAFVFSYPANDKVTDFLSDYLHKTAEAEVISHELDIREYELDYEAAKKAAAAVAIEAEKEEERRIKMLEKNPLGELPGFEEEEDFNFDKKPRRVKKPHHLDEFESAFDDEMEMPGLPRRSAIDRKRRLPPPLETRDSKQPRREFVDMGRKSTSKYDNGKRIAKPPRLSAPGTRFDGTQVRHPGTAPNAVPWSSMEEQLLCAVVHEFGPNFAFAADVLGACSQLQGIFRRASQCREKFKQLTAPTDGQVSQETALAQQITKGQAREIMQKYMPVPETALQTHCSSLVSIAVKHKQMHIQEHVREQEKVQQSQPPHPSQAVVQQAVHSKTANRHLNAMEMIEWAATRHKREQIRQQQLEQQQAQALEQQRLQAQQAGIPGGNMQQPQPTAVPAATGAVGAAAAQQSFLGQNMGPPSHPSPMLPGTTNGDPAMSSAPGGVGIRASMGSMPPGSGSPAVNPTMQPFAGGAPPAPQSSQQQQQLILNKMQQCMANVQKLQQMLNTGKNGAGQPLTDEQRQAYTNNHAAVMRHYKQLQLQYNVLRTGMPIQDVQQRQQQMQMRQQQQQQQGMQQPGMQQPGMQQPGLQQPGIQQQGMQQPGMQQPVMQQPGMQQQQQQGMQPMTQAQASQQSMKPPGYAYSGAMPGQPRPHMGMGQGNMGMPQGAMSPSMPGVGNMQAPQMNGMGMGMPPNAMLNQQGMHPHMMGQQSTAPGLAGMMPPHSSSQAMQGAQQMRPPMAMQQQHHKQS
ncbi:hypothetical protein WJX77_003503 [Trebouxia sp. C0004]